jgi:hypothetical protein
VKHIGRIYIILLFYACSSQAQFIVANEKIRFGFGVSKFTSGINNVIIYDMENLTGENGFPLPISKFNDHAQFYLDYERTVYGKWSFMLSLGYAREVVSGSSLDLFNHVEQYLEYTLNMLQLSVSLVHKYTIFTLQKGNIDIIGGGGWEVVSAAADWSYVFDQMPLRYQSIKFLRSGFNSGGRLFLGLEAPLIPAFLLQLRAGYSYMPEVKLAGEIKSSNLQQPAGATEPIDPQILSADSRYNFSQVWLTFGMAYFF